MIAGGMVLMRMGLAPRVGMVTDGKVGELLPLVATDDLIFGGWDLRGDSVFEAACTHGVVPRSTLDPATELGAITPWPAVAMDCYLPHLKGDNLVRAKSFPEELAILEGHVRTFKKEQKLSRLVMVNLTSTERSGQIEDMAFDRSLSAFEAGLDADDQRISPAMKYLYLAGKLQHLYLNFTPSLSKVPALEQLAQECGVPIAGEDGKTGQTMIKTVLAPAFAARQLFVDGWYSTNILGNNDGLVLNDPGQRQDQGLEQARLSRRILRISRRESPGAHSLLPTAGRRQRGLGQYRSRRLSRSGDADQSQFPLQRLDPRRAARARSREAPRLREARRRARDSAAILGVLQGALSRRGRDAGPRLLQTTRIAPPMGGAHGRLVMSARARNGQSEDTPNGKVALNGNGASAREGSTKQNGRVAGE